MLIDYAMLTCSMNNDEYNSMMIIGGSRLNSSQYFGLYILLVFLCCLFACPGKVACISFSFFFQILIFESTEITSFQI